MRKLRKSENWSHRRAQAIIHFSASSARLPCFVLCCVVLFVVCKVGSRPVKNQHPRGIHTLVPGAVRNPRRGPVGSARPPPEGSPRGRFCSSGVPFPRQRAKQYLRKKRPGSCPGLCGKHPPPPKPTWRAAFWPCQGTFCGRRKRLHTARQPRLKPFLEPALSSTRDRQGGAAPGAVSTAWAGLGERHPSGQGSTCAGTDWVLNL